MAVQAQCYGGVPAAAYDCEAEAQTQQEYNYYYDGYGCKYNRAAAVASGAQSGLTCNVNASGRKRGREAADELCYVPSSALLLPIPGMAKAVDDGGFGGAAGCRVVESAMASTSGRTSAAAFDGEVVSELLHRQGAEMDAVVRAGCERMRAGVEQAQKRQCQSLVRAVTAAAARALQEKEVQLEAAHRRAAALEERLRQAVAESQAWCGLARSNEAVAAGLRATLDHILLLRAAPTEGSGESDDLASPAPLAAADDDAESCCFEAPKENAGSYKWACKACGEGEATVLLLPCRHLCLCKACEPRNDACPVCLAAKNTCVVARSPTEVSQM